MSVLDVIFQWTINLFVEQSETIFSFNSEHSNLDKGLLISS